ncbi:MAG TPA: ABC transporter ATP-binding protein [Gemmatimonadales bacterium]|jgi:oligopeptide/dipeptide ABC transporter ATP-binding protein
MTALLAVEDLSVSFATPEGPARAVDGLTLHIDDGETVGLVGESGCGKTVTALAVLGLLGGGATVAPASRVLFRERDLLRLPFEELRRVRGAEIAMVFQDPGASLNPVLRIGLQVAEVLMTHRDMSRAQAWRRAEELLETVGLADAARVARAYPHELSGGMQQRVMIATAIACEPALLIADEPTTALDVTIQAQVLELLVNLRERLGMAMLLITHDLGVVAGVTDRVAVMYGGEIVEVAPTPELFAAPRHPYTEALLAAVPRIDQPDALPRPIPGQVPPATRWPSGCRFHPRCAQAMTACTTAPPLVELASRHTARCWLHADGESTP